MADKPLAAYTEIPASPEEIWEKGELLLSNFEGRPYPSTPYPLELGSTILHKVTEIPRIPGINLQGLPGVRRLVNHATTLKVVQYKQFSSIRAEVVQQTDFLEEGSSIFVGIGIMEASVANVTAISLEAELGIRGIIGRLPFTRTAIGMIMQHKLDTFAQHFTSQASAQ